MNNFILITGVWLLRFHTSRKSKIKKFYFEVILNLEFFRINILLNEITNDKEFEITNNKEFEISKDGLNNVRYNMNIFLFLLNTSK